MSISSLLNSLFRTVPRIAPDEAVRRAGAGELTLIDIRDERAIRRAGGGRAAGAVHVPALKLRHIAYPKSPAFNPALDPGRAVAVFGEAGSDTEFAARSLMKMGYAEVYDLGALSAWVAGGGPCEAA